MEVRSCKERSDDNEEQSDSQEEELNDVLLTSGMLDSSSGIGSLVDKSTSTLMKANMNISDLSMTE